MCKKRSASSPATKACLFTAAIIHSLTMLCQGGPFESSPLLVLWSYVPSASSHQHSQRSTLLSIFPNRPAETTGSDSAHCHLASQKKASQWWVYFSQEHCSRRLLLKKCPLKEWECLLLCLWEVLETFVRTKLVREAISIRAAAAQKYRGVNNQHWRYKQSAVKILCFLLYF